MNYLLWGIVLYVICALGFMGWAHTWDIKQGFMWPAWVLFGIFGNIQ